MIKPWFIRILYHTTRLALALVFVFAGAAKLSDIAQFADRVSRFGLVYDSLVYPVAWTVVLSEILVGLGMAFHLRGSLTCMVVLLALFVSVVGYGIYLGLDIECGCFGPAFHVALRTQLWIDLALFVACGIVFWSREQCGVQPVKPIV